MPEFLPDTVTNFLNMGGYGTFIWASFGLSAVVLSGLLIQSQRFLKASAAELSALQSGEAKADEA